MIDQFQQFDTALHLLNGRLDIIGAPNFNLVVCGGTALVATGLVMRATRDVDVVALADDDGALVDPVPLGDGGTRGRGGPGASDGLAE